MFQISGLKRDAFRLVKILTLFWIAGLLTFLVRSVHNFNSAQLLQTTDEIVVVESKVKFSLVQRKLSAKHQSVKREYLKPREDKVNAVDYEFILEGDGNVCKPPQPYLLIVIPSVPGHFSQREVIRKTYGSFADNSLYQTNERLKNNATVRIIFVLGNAKSRTESVFIENENRVYGDILQANFTDSYYNLTVKMLLALKWISQHCNDIQYMLKVDEDVFLNVPFLVRFLQVQHVYRNGQVFGHIHKDKEVLRKGRWAVSYSEFPLTHYPNYAAGNSYVISGNIIPRMFAYSEYLPYLSIEDAFITGCLGELVGAKKEDVYGFTWWEEYPPHVCEFYEHNFITANRMDVSLHYKFWAAYRHYDLLCNTYRDTFGDEHFPLSGTISLIKQSNIAENNQTYLR